MAQLGALLLQSIGAGAAVVILGNCLFKYTVPLESREHLAATVIRCEQTQTSNHGLVLLSPGRLLVPQCLVYCFPEPLDLFKEHHTMRTTGLSQ